MEKNVIFISHSTHQDDYPAAWLASKLTLLGYKVFIDLDDLRAGDMFYTKIQPIIQHQTCRFITINTHSYIQKAADANSGVRKEINAASSITTISNFLIPVRFDGISFDSFPMDYLGRNCIDFYNRWGEALNELIDELEKLSTPKAEVDTNPLSLWHKAIRNKNQCIDSVETIYSNWFEVYLPQYIYVHKPNEIDKMLLRQIPATTILEGNRIICFASNETVATIIPIESTFQIETEKFINSENIFVDDQLVLIKPYDKLKNLLNKSFKDHSRKKGLQLYKQASKKEIFYFRFTKDHHKPIVVSLKKYNKTRTHLNGNKWGINWHFAISAKSELKPFPHFRVFYHVIFSDNNRRPFEDDSVQQEYRKKFSSILYNKKTFEMMLASLVYLSEGPNEQFIQVQIDHSRKMNIDTYPLSFKSNKSYVEPSAAI